MKKTFLLFIIAGFCACSNNADEKSAENTSTESAAEIEKRRADSLATAAANAEKERGIELIGKSDCLTCHKLDEKLVGPPYREVANKYNADDQTKTQLAEKIIKGGAGVWGTVAMPPHPTISQDDAKAMVGYILSLKQK
jgi:cytochrome c